MPTVSQSSVARFNAVTNQNQTSDANNAAFQKAKIKSVYEANKKELIRSIIGPSSSFGISAAVMADNYQPPKEVTVKLFIRKNDKTGHSLLTWEFNPVSFKSYADAKDIGTLNMSGWRGLTENGKLEHPDISLSEEDTKLASADLKAGEDYIEVTFNIEKPKTPKEVKVN